MNSVWGSTLNSPGERKWPLTTLNMVISFC